jgi:hypothetical protein
MKFLLLLIYLLIALTNTIDPPESIYQYLTCYDVTNDESTGIIQLDKTVVWTTHVPSQGYETTGSVNVNKSWDSQAGEVKDINGRVVLKHIFFLNNDERELIEIEGYIYEFALTELNLFKYKQLDSLEGDYDRGKWISIGDNYYEYHSDRLKVNCFRSRPQILAIMNCYSSEDGNKVSEIQFEKFGQNKLVFEYAENTWITKMSLMENWEWTDQGLHYNPDKAVLDNNSEKVKRSYNFNKSEIKYFLAGEIDRLSGIFFSGISDPNYHTILKLQVFCSID